MRLALAALTVIPTLAFAGGFRDSVQDASDAMDQALAAARRGGQTCRAALKAPIDRAIDDVDDLLNDRGSRRIGEVREQVNSLAVAAQRSGCPETVVRKLSRAVEELDDARDGRRRDRDDRRDDRYDGPRAQNVGTPVQFAQLRLYPSVIHDTENKVRVDVPEVRFVNQAGLRFRLAARVRAQNGQFGEWQVDNMYQVPQQDYAWPNATSFFIRHSTLKGIDTANGKFVVRVSVLNEANEELGAVDQPLEINFRGPPAPAPPAFVPGAPPPGQPVPGPHARPIPTIMQRDCGTGNDPGCNQNRGGVLPMDRGTFQGLMASLQNTPSEISREQMVGNVLVNNGITAMQLGQVLDQFRSEVSKMNVARKAAPRTSDPGNAIGHSVKFRSSINQTEYVKLMSAQR